MAKLKVAADGGGRGEEFRGKNIATVLQGSRGSKRRKGHVVFVHFLGVGTCASSHEKMRFELARSFPDACGACCTVLCTWEKQRAEGFCFGG